MFSPVHSVSIVLLSALHRSGSIFIGNLYYIRILDVKIFLLKVTMASEIPATSITFDLNSVK